MIGLLKKNKGSRKRKMKNSIFQKKLGTLAKIKKGWKNGEKKGYLRRKGEDEKAKRKEL